MLIDPLGRHIRYLRLSVTDRCDMRCVYCMGEDVQLSPKSDILSLEELERLCDVFIGLGVRILRLTGGEPLVRRDVLTLMTRLGRRLGEGLDDLTLTTNGSLLAQNAQALADAGVKRLNVSLDTLSPDMFRHLTRTGDVAKVIAGIDAALAVGLQVKVNMVVLRGINTGDIDAMIQWCGARGITLCLLETMPLGDVGPQRTECFLALDHLQRQLERRWTLEPLSFRGNGPARYVRVGETGGLLGFITPLSHTFCGNCNRIRVTATGRLYPCLGSESFIDLRPMVRAHENVALRDAISAAILTKPANHAFTLESDTPYVQRLMHVTGG